MDNKITKEIINNLIKVMSIAVNDSTHKESAVKELNGSFRYFSGV